MKQGVVFLLISLLSSSFLFFASETAQEKINMYTFYTPSHEIFHDFCIGTLHDEGITVITKKFPQECPSGEVFTDKWQLAMLRKVDMIIDAIKDNWGKVFIYSDTDIQYFQPISKRIKALIGDKDLVIQRESPSGVVCAGFFACKGNEKTLALWEGIRDYMIKNRECSDQRTLNRLLRRGRRGQKNSYNVSWDYLPVQFLSGGTLTGKAWAPGNYFPVPTDIVLHHANWTVGNENKLAQLAYVRNKVQDMKHE